LRLAVELDALKLAGQVLPNLPNKKVANSISGMKSQGNEWMRALNSCHKDPTKPGAMIGECASGGQRRAQHEIAAMKSYIRYQNSNVLSAAQAS
jgi:hypothetical protein